MELKSIECNEWREKYDTLVNRLESDAKVVSQIVSSIIHGDFTPVSNYDVDPILQPLKTQVEALMLGIASFASEITRVTTDENFVVHPDSASNLSGNWATALNSVNSFVQDTSTQYDAIIKQAISVATGTLDEKLPTTGKGKQLELQYTLNTMTDQLYTLATEVTRITYETGVEGKLDGNLVVKGAAGAWKDLVNNIGTLTSTLTCTIRSSCECLTAICYGDFSKRMYLDLNGEFTVFKDTLNTLVSELEDFVCLILTASESRRKETETEAILRKYKQRGAWKLVLNSVID